MSKPGQIDDSGFLTYLRLQHPAVLDGAPENPLLHDMVDYVCGCSYQNKPWVVAEFTDGSKWAYYGDPPVVVGAIRNGVVLKGLEGLEDIANHLKDAVDTVTGLTTTVVPAGSRYAVEIVGEPSSILSLDKSTDSTEGLLFVSNISEGDAGSGGVQATATIVIRHVTEGGAVTKLEIGSGTTWEDIIDPTLAITVSSVDDTGTFAAKIAAAINSYLMDNQDAELEATASNATVYVKSTSTGGITANNKKLRMTTTASGTGAVIVSNATLVFPGVGMTLSSLVDSQTPPHSLITTPLVVAATIKTDLPTAINALSLTSGYVAAPYGAVGVLKILISKRVVTSDEAADTIVATTNIGDALTAAYSDFVAMGTLDPAVFTVSFTRYDIGMVWYEKKIGGIGATEGFYLLRQNNFISGVAGGYEGELVGKWVRVSPDFRDIKGNLVNYDWINTSPWYYPTFKKVGSKVLSLPPSQIFELQIHDTPVAPNTTTKFALPAPRILVKTIFQGS